MNAGRPTIATGPLCRIGRQAVIPQGEPTRQRPLHSASEMS